MEIANAQANAVGPAGGIGPLNQQNANLAGPIGGNNNQNQNPLVQAIAERNQITTILEQEAQLSVQNIEEFITKIRNLTIPSKHPNIRVFPLKRAIKHMWTFVPKRIRRVYLSKFRTIWKTLFFYNKGKKGQIYRFDELFDTQTNRVKPLCFHNRDAMQALICCAAAARVAETATGRAIFVDTYVTSKAFKAFVRGYSDDDKRRRRGVRGGRRRRFRRGRRFRRRGGRRFRRRFRKLRIGLKKTRGRRRNARRRRRAGRR